jgi:hypothetical protein
MGSRAAVPLELEIEASTARVAPSLAMVNLPSIRSCLVAIGRHLESFNIDEARWCEIMERRVFSRNSTTLKLTSGRRVESKAGPRDCVEDRLVTWHASSIRDRLGARFLERNSSAQGPDCNFLCSYESLDTTSNDISQYVLVFEDSHPEDEVLEIS